MTFAELVASPDPDYVPQSSTLDEVPPWLIQEVNARAERGNRFFVGVPISEMTADQIAAMKVTARGMRAELWRADVRRIAKRCGLTETACLRAMAHIGDLTEVFDWAECDDFLQEAYARARCPWWKRVFNRLPRKT